MNPTASRQPQEQATPLGQKLGWLLEALLLAVFWQICSLLTLDRASAFGQAIMRRLGPHLWKNKRIWRNLRLAFPYRPAAEIDALTRDCWGNLGRVIAEYPHLATISGTQDIGRIKLVVRDEQAAWRRANKPAIFVSAHLANWELAGSKAVTGTIPLVGIYSPQSNPLIDRMIRKKRRALGCELVTKDAGVREIMRQLQSGRSIGVLADLRVDSGELLPFFRYPARTTTVPAGLALHLGLELVPVRIERRDGGRFRVTAFKAVVPRDTSKNRHEQALDMMSQVNKLFESWIRNRPAEWLCSKRRWPKTTRPKRAGGKPLAAKKTPE